MPVLRVGGRRPGEGVRPEGAIFFPDGTKAFAWTFAPNHVNVAGPARICSDCGAVWARADAAQFRERYRRWRKGDAGRAAGDR
ncbi:MAG: hypothetical protein JWO31_1417 [Phycisphaerales bacterium]|nr:hypothetical protein [Phycisphaerales bacterium]